MPFLNLFRSRRRSQPIGITPPHTLLSSPVISTPDPTSTPALSPISQASENISAPPPPHTFETPAVPVQDPQSLNAADTHPEASPPYTVLEEASRKTTGSIPWASSSKEIIPELVEPRRGFGGPRLAEPVPAASQDEDMPQNHHNRHRRPLRNAQTPHNANYCPTPTPRRKNLTTRRCWVCVDISPDKKFLANCKACRNKKTYGANYNAAAHLRRAHFYPIKQRGRRRGDERRGGMGGGNWPSMDTLKEWMVEVVETVQEQERSPTLDDEAIIDDIDLDDYYNIDPWADDEYEYEQHSSLYSPPYLCASEDIEKPGRSSTPSEDRRRSVNYSQRSLVGSGPVIAKDGSPCIFEGWILVKATDLEGQEAKWSRVIRTLMNADHVELRTMISKSKQQKRGIQGWEQYRRLDTTKQNQLDKLIEDRKNEDRDPRVQWGYALVEKDERQFQKNGKRGLEVSLNVVLRKKFPQDAQFLFGIPPVRTRLSGTVCDLNAPEKKDKDKDKDNKGKKKVTFATPGSTITNSDGRRFFIGQDGNPIPIDQQGRPIVFTNNGSQSGPLRPQQGHPQQNGHPGHVVGPGPRTGPMPGQHGGGPLPAHIAAAMTGAGRGPGLPPSGPGGHVGHADQHGQPGVDVLESRPMEGGRRAVCASDGDEKEGARRGASRHADQHGQPGDFGRARD